MSTNTITERKLRNAARRGAAKLDKALPEWFMPRFITLDELDLASGEHCILGQIADGIARRTRGVEARKRYLADGVEYQQYDYCSITASHVCNGPQRLKDKFKALGFNERNACRYGVNINFWNARPSGLTRQQCWEVLDDEWSKQIIERRNARKAALKAARLVSA